MSEKRIDDKEIMAAIASYGVTGARVEFNGCGDSGQIDGIEIVARDVTVNGEATALRGEHVPLLNDMFGRPSQGSATLHDLVEHFAYELLERTGMDWYNNDGGFGTVDLEPTTGKINVNMNINETISHEYPFDYSLERADG